MARMHFREENMVAWIGTRPGHNGTQVAETVYAVANTLPVYTVPAGQTFYLCTALMSIRLIAAGIVTIDIRTDAAAAYLYLFNEGVTVGQQSVSRIATFWPPIELPAGYYVQVISSAAGLGIRGSVFGWVE